MRNLLEIISEEDSLRAFRAAIKIASLEQVFRGHSLTVFAPFNDAFFDLPPGHWDRLLASEETLMRILSCHIVPERLAAADLLRKPFLEACGGARLKVCRKPYLKVGGARIEPPGILAQNGLIYTIDRLLYNGLVWNLSLRAFAPHRYRNS